MGKVLVCGLGQVGYRIARLLGRMGIPTQVLTLDPREEFTQDLIPFGVKVEIGDARADRALLGVGLTETDTVIVCTDSDLTNIEIALDAKRLHPGVCVVARLFDLTLARRLQQSGVVDRAFGMSTVAAPAFASAAMGRLILGQFEWQGKNYAVQEVDEGQGIDDTPYSIVPIKVESRSAIKSRSSLRALLNFPGQIWGDAPRPIKIILGLIVCLGLLSVLVFNIGMKLSPIDAFYFVTTTLTTTGYGDITPKDHPTWVKVYTCFLMLMGSAAIATLYSLLTDFIVSERFNQILGRQQVTHTGHVIVAGLGNVGFRTANHLAESGADVVVVDVSSNPQYRGFLEEELLFLVGDARDPQVLERAAIADASAVIAATDDDAVNLSICLAAKEINEKIRAVARLFDDRFAEKVEQSMPVDVAISASRIAAPRFVGAALEPESLLSFVTGHAFISILPPGPDGEFHIVRRPLS